MSKTETKAGTRPVFTVEIPIVGTVTSTTSVGALGDAAWDAVHSGGNGGYGASQVGSGWPVKKDGVLIGTMRYNGRFDAALDATVATGMGYQQAPCRGGVMSAMHTPGPWRLAAGLGLRTCVVFDGTEELTALTIAVVEPEDEHSEAMKVAKANATLIMAAPDMAAVLREVADFWAGGDAPQALTDKINAALAKAGV